MFKGKVLLFSLLLVFATSLYAGEVDDCLSDVSLSCVGMRVSICPAGDFEFIRTGCGGTDDHIIVYARDSAGNGVSGIPRTDYWIQACDPAEELCLCTAPIVADSITNDLGRTTISGRIAGGGCILNGGAYIAIQGQIVLEEPCGSTDWICLDIIIVSPDLTADCVVNLSDLGVFGLSYNKSYPETGYNDCCDYNDDTHCNLSDFAFMGEHYLHECF